MGKNNRTRRQQKQRKKTSKGPRQQSLSHALDYDVQTLCGLIEGTLYNQVFPPPIEIRQAVSAFTSTGIKPLYQLTIGFFYYLFTGAPPCGDAATLGRYEKSFRAVQAESVYRVLQTYCWLTELPHQDSATAEMSKRIKSVPAQQRGVTELYIETALLLLGHSDLSASKLKPILHSMLGSPGVGQLVGPLTKFLTLKNPKPALKSAEKLDIALARTDWRHQLEWRLPVARLLQLFCLSHRASTEVMDWSSRPHLRHYLDLRQDESIETCSPQGLNAITVTLHRLEEAANSPLSYAERLQKALLACRLNAEMVGSLEQHHTELHSQTLQLVELCCTGVPPAQQPLAKKVLNRYIDWLVEHLHSQAITPLPWSSLRRATRLLPDDFRLGLMAYLDGVSPTGNRPFVNHINPELFFYAFKRQTKPQRFLQAFYLPLSNDQQNTLAFFVGKGLLTQASPGDKADLPSQWQAFSQLMLNVDRPPLQNVLKGQACEQEWLFICTLAVLESVGIHWLNKDNIAPLLRVAERWITQTKNTFLVNRVSELIIQCCGAGLQSTLLSESIILDHILQRMSAQQRKRITILLASYIELLDDDSRNNPAIQHFRLTQKMTRDITQKSLF